VPLTVEKTNQAEQTKWVLLIITCLVFIAYGTSLLNGFVIDDPYILLDNFTVRKPGNLKYLFSRDYFQLFMEQTYRPVVTLSYMLDFQIWGLRPFGFHLHNLILHLLNTLLVYSILRHTGNGFFPALVTAGLFACHTISGEAVNVISFREDLQVVFLMLLSVYGMIKILKGNNKGYQYLVWISCFLAVLAKENGLVLAFLMAGVAFIIRGRRFYKENPLLWTGALVCFLLGCIVRFVLMNHAVNGAGPLTLMGTVYEKTIKIAKIQGIYLQSFFYLKPFLPNMGGELLTGHIDGDFLTMIITGMLFFLWVVLLRDPRAWAAILFYILAMGPASNLIPLNNPIAYRYLYFPALGIYFLLALTLQKLKESWELSNHYVPVLLTIVFLPPAVFSCVWNRHFKDDVSLWSYNIRYMPDYYRLWADLSAAQNNKGLYIEADESARFALSLNRDYFYAWAALGTSQIHRGLYREALDSYTSALRYPSVRGNRAEIYFGMGYGLSALDNNSEAQARYEKALKENPDHTGALTNLAILYCQNGNYTAARPLLERVIAKDPGDKEAHFNLALLYIQTGNREKAQIHIREVLKLDPDNARARQMLNILDQDPLKQEYLKK